MEQKIRLRETEPFDFTALNARATGYFAKRLVDIGTIVVRAWVRGHWGDALNCS